VTTSSSRRSFLIGGTTAALAAAAWPHGLLAPARAAARRLPSGLFSLGVAAGEPSPSGAVLWSRLAPAPLEPSGGMPHRLVPVEWEVADDDRFRRVARRGVALASPALAHSVHAEVQGLRPDRWYHYRFRARGQHSPVGRFRTAPAPGTRASHLRVAVASCQDWQNGYFAAYRHIAEEDHDLVVHLGDYIYEEPITPDGTPGTPGFARDRLPPAHACAEATTLEQYRWRYALYKSDPQLQLAHASCAWAVTWDDHEVDGNWAAGVPYDPERQSPQHFAARIAAARQAYFEHMPLRPRSWSRSGLRLYRRLGFGDLLTINVTDTRSYRSDQGCGPDDRTPPCGDFIDPSRTMLGATQEAWLLDGLARTSSRWNVVTAQVPMARLDYQPGPGELLSGDKWDGYAVSRQRILDSFADRSVPNPVVLSGDAHVNIASDLTLDFSSPDADAVGTELTCTGIASRGATVAEDAGFRALLGQESPHVRFFEGYKRGYLSCTIDRDRWVTAVRAVDTAGERGQVVTPGAAASTTATLVVEDGRPGPTPA
jgi:alkaline phosphatase D